MTELPFPEGFLWGAATSAYQVEGGNAKSDWAEWERNTGHEACGAAAGQYERFAEDFSLAKSLSHNAHRLGVEWARLNPSQGVWDEEAIRHYQTVLSTLRRLGFKVCVTLHHFTLPAWLAKRGGWEWAGTLGAWREFVALAAERFGGWVDLWITINEPTIHATQAYLFGAWPPQAHSRSRAVAVLKNLLRAHTEAYRLLHEKLPSAQVGFAHNVISLEPLRPWLVTDRWAAHRADRFWNTFALEETAGQHDFLGLNYYFHQRAFLSLNPRRMLVGFADPKRLRLEVSRLGWEVRPSGLGEMLARFGEKYTLPLYVTENGIDPVDESQRTSFLVRSLGEVHSAIASGADVKGYFYWSLVDNFEWDKGFAPKFGLVEVDRSTLKRTPREAAYEFKRIAESNAL